MRETKPCPQCGAQMQHRDKHGDVVCAYCNTVLFMADTPEAARPYSRPYAPNMLHSGTFCMSMGTVAYISDDTSYGPRDVWRL